MGFCIRCERMSYEAVIIPAEQHFVVRGIESEVGHEADEVVGKLYSFHRDGDHFSGAQHFDPSGPLACPFQSSCNLTTIHQTVATDSTQAKRHPFLRERFVTLDGNVS